MSRHVVLSARRLPPLLLLLALSTVFLFGNDRGHFYRTGEHHTRVSANYLTVAENLSPEHNFLSFYYRTLDEDGTPAYHPYNRFPLGGYALIKLAMLPFGDGLSAKILAARMVMLLSFVGSGALAYLSLCRLAGSCWIALAATLLAFSSYYLLYYNDMVATENGLSLFGVLLAFHGMVLFAQEGRFRQLLVKACAALLLGWHVYALLLSFIVLGALSGLKRARRPSVPFGLAVKSWVSAPPFRRCLTLGAVTLLFGMAVLSFNLGNERRALGGEVPLAELPTAQSMAKRFGGDDEFNERNAKRLAWGNFLEDQLYRVARSTLPFSISPFHNREADRLGVIVGAVALGGAVMALLAARQKMLLATLLCAGFCWAFPVRHHTAIQEYEAVFFVGVPLVLFAAGLLRLRGLFGGRLVVGLAAAALVLFVLSSFQMGRLGHDRQASELHEADIADFERIRAIAEPGQSVFIPMFGGGMIDRRIIYYLAGRVIGRSRGPVSPDSSAYDYFVSPWRMDVPALLTPANRRFFLYRQSGYPTQMDDMIGASELLLRRDGCCDVHRSGNRLFYLGRRAQHDSAADMRFFLHLYPVDAGDLPDRRRRHGFDSLDFRFGDHLLPLTERPVAVRELPGYAIARLRTGQYLVNEDDSLTYLWEAEVRFNE